MPPDDLLLRADIALRESRRLWDEFRRRSELIHLQCELRDAMLELQSVCVDDGADARESV